MIQRRCCGALCLLALLCLAPLATAMQPATDKANLTEAQKKLSSDLLERVLSDEPGAGEEIVEVCVSLNPPAPTSVIDPYAVEVTDRDEEAHLAVARVRVDRLEDLAALPEIRTIMTVLPPVTRDPTATPEASLGVVSLLGIGAALLAVKRR
jgi:hypothetical protein